MTELPISQRTLGELLQSSLTSSFCVSIPQGTPVWVITGMLVQYLESFTDSVVIRDGYTPKGVIGGKDIIERIFENPSSDFFYKNSVDGIMDTNLLTVTKDTKLNELLEHWKQTRRAFAIIRNEWNDYSAISTRKLLEIGKNCKTDMSISSLPKKKVITFKKSDSIRDVLNSMLQHKTRRLVLENSSEFVNDRVILEKISEELGYLRGIDNFLDLPADDLKLENAKITSRDLTIPEVSEILFTMEHPYVIWEDQVISPWDICIALLSPEVIKFKHNPN